MRKRIRVMHCTGRQQEVPINGAEEGRLFLFPKGSRLDVGNDVGFGVVMREDFVVLAAFFHESELPALAGLEVIFDSHRDRSGHEREAVDHLQSAPGHEDQ